MKGRIFLVLFITASLLWTPANVRGEGAPPGLTGGSLVSSNASFEGQVAGDQAGMSVAIAGDVNGDGYADLLIGAPFYDTDVGRVYLFLGEPGGWRLDENLASADGIYTGEAGDEAGTSVDSAGDVNGDGLDDIIVGSPGGNFGFGQVILIYGSSTIGGELAGNGALYSNLGVNNRMGVSVSGVGDANGDGYDDVLIGDPGYDGGIGEVTLWLGASSAGSMTAVTYVGDPDDEAGTSVAGVGDVNGDGYPDFAAGSPGFNADGGVVNLFYGSATIPFLSPNGGLFGSGGSGNRLGASVSGVGDVNGDGFDDVLVGSPNANSNQGEVTLWMGATSPARMMVVDYAGANAGDQAGSSVGGAGDVNGDGYADMLIGAPGYSSFTGRTYLLLGSSSPTGSNLSGASALFTGVSSGDQAGSSVAGAGDVSGDGYSDFVIGTSGYGSSRGKAYLLFSDYTSATAARYRSMINSSQSISTKVGFSGVTAQYSSGSPGSIYVTRHYRNTCGTNFATNGLLWTVDSQRGASAQATFTFRYNNTQIAGMTEGNLKLYYRNRPCQDWTQDSSATLNTSQNYITSSSVTDAHREFIIADSQPSPTILEATNGGVTMAKEPLWLVAGVMLLIVFTVGAQWWGRRLDKRDIPTLGSEE